MPLLAPTGDMTRNASVMKFISPRTPSLIDCMPTTRPFTSRYMPHRAFAWPKLFTSTERSWVTWAYFSSTPDADGCQGGTVVCSAAATDTMGRITLNAGAETEPVTCERSQKRSATVPLGATAKADSVT